MMNGLILCVANKNHKMFTYHRIELAFSFLFPITVCKISLLYPNMITPKVLIFGLVTLFLTQQTSVEAQYFTLTPPILLSCRLQWIPYARGNQLPENLVYVHNNGKNSSLVSGVIARKRIFGNWRLGTLNENHVGHFLQNRNVLHPWNYELLTNPNGCVYEWVSQSNASMKEFSVDFGSGKSKSKIGQIFFPSQKAWLLCQFQPTGCHYVNDKGYGVADMSKNFQVLVSFSPSLSMALQKLSFTIVSDIRNVEVLGVDTIRNKGDATISRSIEHRTTTVKTINWNFGFGFRIQIGLSFNFMKNWLMPRAADLAGYLAFGQTYDWSNSRVTTDTSTLTRDVEVPPRTSIEIVATIVMRSVCLNISGEGIVSSDAGLGGREIARALQLDPQFQDPTIYENNVVIPINLTMCGTAPFSTEMIVLPYNAYKASSSLKLRNHLSHKIFQQSVLDKGFQPQELSALMDSLGE